MRKLDNKKGGHYAIAAYIRHYFRGIQVWHSSHLCYLIRFNIEDMYVHAYKAILQMCNNNIMMYIKA